MTTETAHRLINYSGKCAHLHGHSYHWEITIGATVLNNGMIMDFTDLKTILKETIGKLDHALVLCLHDPMIANSSIVQVENMLKATNGDDGRYFLVQFNPTVENLIKWKVKEIIERLPKNITLISVFCSETDNNSALWTNGDDYEC